MIKEFILTYWPYFASAALGGIVAYVELLNRYNTHFGGIIRAVSAVLYIVINGIISAVCLYLLRTYGFFDVEINHGKNLGQVILAGVGSMSLLRSSIFTIRSSSGNQKQVGAIEIVEALLKSVEREFDRHSSSINLQEVGKIMQNVNIRRYGKDLITTCLNVMQGLSPEEQERLGKDVSKLMNEVGISEEIRAINIGVVLARITGEKLLRYVVTTVNVRKVEEENSPVCMDIELSQAQEKLLSLTKKLQEGAP